MPLAISCYSNEDMRLLKAIPTNKRSKSKTRLGFIDYTTGGPCFLRSFLQSATRGR